MSERSKGNKVGKVDGVACVGEPPVPVWVIKREWDRGRLARQILRDYPRLTTDDLHAACGYASKHSKEVGALIRADEQGGIGCESTSE